MSIYINLIPYHHIRITRFNVHQRLRVNWAIRWNTTSKRRHLPTILGRQRNKVNICQALKPVCSTILIEWLGTAEWVAWSFPYSNCRRGSHWMHFWCGPLTTTRKQICLPWIYSKGLQCCWLLQFSLHWWTWQPYGNLKLESKHQHDTWVIGRLNSERENLPVETHGKVSISLRRHLGLWLLLLQYSGEANSPSLCPLE